MYTTDLGILYQDFLQPSLIAGDFNAHSYLWGYLADDTRGNTIESFMHKTTCTSGMIIIVLHSATDCPVLTMCSPQLFVNLSGSVEDVSGVVTTIV